MKCIASWFEKDLYNTEVILYLTEATKEQATFLQHILTGLEMTKIQGRQF